MSLSAWYRTGTVNVTNGSDIVVGQNTAFLSDTGKPFAGDEFTIDNKESYEIVQVIEENRIKLDRAYTGSTQSGLPYAIKRLASRSELARGAADISRVVAQKQQTLDEVSKFFQSTNDTEEFTDRFGEKTTVNTIHKYNESLDDIVAKGGNIKAMRSVVFDAMCNANQLKYGASGFVEFGKALNNPSVTVINEGAQVTGNSPQSSLAKGLALGSNAPSTIGNSLSHRPVLNVSGALIDIDYLNRADGNYSAQINFPPAPDGLDKADGTGRFADINEAITAGGNDLTASVINRQDFVGLECWDELVSDKDVVYPLGNVQYLGNEYKGVGIASTFVDRGYSAFGEWDSETKGCGAKWSTLSDAQKDIFLNDPKNNLRYENGQLVQRRYRVRVVAGLEGAWSGLFPTNDEYLASNSSNYGSVIARGKLDNNKDRRGNGFADYVSSKLNPSGVSILSGDNGVFSIRKEVTGNTPNPDDISHKSFCVLIPICLVSRLNQGAYHPVYNPNGACNWGGNGNQFYAYNWNVSGTYPSLGLTALSVSDCFLNKTTAPSGTLSTGSTGNPASFYSDAVYSDQVQDLRLDVSGKYTPQTAYKTLLDRALSGKARSANYLTSMIRKGCVPASSSHSLYVLNDLLPTHNPPTNEDDGDIIAIRITEKGGTTLDSRLNVGVWYFGVTSQTGSSYPRVRLDVLNGDLAIISSGNTADLLVDVMWFGNPTTGESRGYKTDICGTGYHTDIIGSPDNILATFPEGVHGLWVPEIPNGSNKTFRFSKKITDYLGRVFTTNNGATWSTGTSNPPNYSEIGNSYTLAEPANLVMLSNYQTGSEPTTKVQSQPPIKHSDWNVWAGNIGLETHGAFLIQSLIGKVPVTYGFSTLPLKHYGIETDSKTLATSGATGKQPEHDTINISGENSPAVKVLPYLSGNSSIAELTLIYKEMAYAIAWDNGEEFTDISGTDTGMKSAGMNYHVVSGKYTGYWRCIRSIDIPSFDSNVWSEVDGKLIYQNGAVYFERWNGNGFGDDNKFIIAGGDNTGVDLNANPIKYGTHVSTDDLKIYLKGH